MPRARIANLSLRQKRELRHWSIELAVVVVGVLLALMAAEWAQERREASDQREALERLDAVITKTQAMGAVRVATSQCLKDRIAELDTALVTSDGDWQAMPLPRLDPRMTENTAFPFVYTADSIDVPLHVFQLAEENGALSALSPEKRAHYDAIRQDIVWLSENWRSGWLQSHGLGLLGLDGTFAETTIHDLRKQLDSMSRENHVSVVRARSLHANMKRAGLTPSEEDLAMYQSRVDQARSNYGDCIIDIDPVTLEENPS